MMKLLILSLITTAALGDLRTNEREKPGFEWKSSPVFPNGTVVHGCVGDKITLPWVFETTSTKEISIEWVKSSPGLPGNIVAVHASNTFIPVRSANVLLEFLPNAGLMLSKAKLSDSGYYRVEVNIPGDSISVRQGAIVQVFEPPSTVDDRLHAFILPESVYQAKTGQWHVQLGCGNFLSLGQPPVTVTWTTPSSQNVKSTSYTNNSFVLMLSYPAKEGNYSCSLDPTSIAIQCLQNVSAMKYSAIVHVKGLHTPGISETPREELTILSDQVSDLKGLIESLHPQNDSIEEKISILTNETETLTVDVRNLESKIEHVTGLVKDIEEKIIEEESAVQTIQAQNEELNTLLKKYDDLNMRFLMLQSNFKAHVKDTFGLSLIPSTEDNERRPASCEDVKKYDQKNGIHTLFLPHSKTVNVYCDQTKHDGGWAVILRRQDGSVDFYQDLEQYAEGFGNLNGEFWIGLLNLFHMTKNKTLTFRVDIEHFNGSTAYAVYKGFTVNGPHDNYRLTIGEYSGTAGDAIVWSNQIQFSTFDSDHDIAGFNCAQARHGGWWYRDCTFANLNGRYKLDGAHGVDGVTWVPWTDYNSLKRVVVKIK